MLNYQNTTVMKNNLSRVMVTAFNSLPVVSDESVDLMYLI